MGQWTEEQPKKKRTKKNFCNEYIVFFVDEKKTFFFSLSYKLGQRANLRIICVVCVSVGRACGWRGWN